MFELIGWLVTGVAAAFGYVQSRSFVSRRLSAVDAAQRPGAPWIAGAAATVLALPLVWVLPLVGGGTALLFGAGVGLGVAAGARDSRRRLPSG